MLKLVPKITAMSHVWELSGEGLPR